MNLSELKRFALQTVTEAGALTLPFFRQKGSALVVNKDQVGGFDPVTQVDKLCETFIREKIAATYPNHAISGEEYQTHGTHECEWVIDPIDGTRAFLSGFLHWGVLLGLLVNKKPVLGAMAQPFTGEVFIGDCDTTHHLHQGTSTTLHSSDCRSLQQATLATTDPRLFKSSVDARLYKRVEDTVQLVRYGNDCYQYAMLAHGQVDLVIENELKPWDILPLVPIIQGAGGVVVNWEGGEDLSEGRVLAVANRRLLDQVLTRLRED